MYPIRWEVGLIFTWRGDRWTVIAKEKAQEASAPFVVRVQNMTDHHILTMCIADLATWMERGEVTIEHRPGPERTLPRGDALAVSEIYWKQALERRDAIQPLLNRPMVTEAEACRVAASCGVTPRTVWRWLRGYRAGGVEALIPARGFVRAHETRWKDPRVAEICNRALEDQYLKLWAPSKIHVIRAIQDACVATGVPAPSRPTLYRCIDRVPAATTIQKREGRQQFEARFLATPRHFTTTDITHPLQLIEIDHTLLDLELIDEETGMALGRPWLTLGFDAYSRMPWGYFLSFDPPSAIAVMMCIRHGVLRKHAHDRYGTQHDWPVWGVPASLIVDNGKEFHAHHIRTLCATLEIDLRYRPRRTPRFGAVIERTFGTINARVLHNLLGNTKTMVNVKMKNRNPQDEAVWTLPLLDTLLHVYFADWHPHEVHGSLHGHTPLQMWTEGLDLTGAPRYPNDIDAFHRATLPVITRVVSREGIVKDHLHYHHPALKALVGSTEPVTVRWDPLDLSYILVRPSQVDEWIVAIADDGPAMQMTAMEFRRIRRMIANANQDVSRHTIRQARDRIRQLEASAVSARAERVRDSKRLRAVAPLLAQRKIGSGPRWDTIGTSTEIEDADWVPPPEVRSGLPDL
jgi:putative transposase